MGKLSDLFTQARKGRSSKGLGFVGKSVSSNKPRAAAMLVEVSGTEAGSAEAALKAGADGLLFLWNGETTGRTKISEVGQILEDGALLGLYIAGGWNNLERNDFEQFKEQGVSFVVLPLSAPARLLSLHIKDLEIIVSVPMRGGELYPVFLRNLSAFDNIAAVHLDFDLSSELSSLSIEDVLQYRAVREAVRGPALVKVKGTLDEEDAYTLLALGVQAVILGETKDTETTQQQVVALRSLLEKVHDEDKDISTLGLTNRG